MSRALLAVLALSACASTNDKGTAMGLTDSGADATIAPPVACPVGELLLNQNQFDRDREMLESWNDLRLAGGSCDGDLVDSANALTADEGLMWTARCWALDISINGPPTADETFSNGEHIDDVAIDMGFAGIINGWGIQGGHDTAEIALQAWVDGGGPSCERLWADGTFGGAGVSRAGGTLVLTRLSAFGPG